MKILSIEKAGTKKVGIWVEDGGQYKNLVVYDDGITKEYVAVNKSKYKNYEHFVGVMGKFNPWTFFRIKPVNMAKLDFEDLVALADKWEKEDREYARKLRQEGKEDVG